MIRIKNILAVIMFFVVLSFLFIYSYNIAMSNDGMIITEYKIVGACVADGFENYYSVLVSVPDSKYIIKNIPFNSKYIISNESKLVEFEEMFTTSYIIYYKEIVMCRK